MGQRTQLINAVLAHPAECGIISDDRVKNIGLLTPAIEDPGDAATPDLVKS